MPISEHQRQAINAALEVAQKLEREGPWNRTHGIAPSEADCRTLVNGLRAAAALIEPEPT